MNTTLKAFSIMVFLAMPGDMRAQPEPGAVLWTYETGTWVRTSPSLSPDGTIYLGTDAGLCAITNNGVVASNKWTSGIAMTLYASSAVGADGTIYSGSLDGNLYAINPDGSQKWSYPAQSGSGSPAIGYDNTIYLQGSDYLYAITPLGGLKWRFFLGDTASYRSPVIGPDGTIYVVSDWTAQLYALKPDGTQRWARQFQGSVSDSPAIGADGTIYVPGVFLYAFAPDGTQLWYTPTNNFAHYSPAIAKDGNIYIGDFNAHYLNALNSSGQLLWRVLQDVAKGTLPTVPAIDSSGTLYYCASNSVCAISSEGQVRWTVYGGLTGAGIYLANTSPVIGPDGTVYAALGSKLYAIYNTNKLADSSWPMYRQNPRHTGKVEKPALKPPQKRSDANFELQLFPQQLGLTYTVESSTNLNTWTSLTSFVATALPMVVVDLSASNAPAKFYRAFSPP